MTGTENHARGLRTTRGWAGSSSPTVHGKTRGTSSHRFERALLPERRWVKAEDAKAGDTFRGPKTGSVYTLLDTPSPTGSGLLELLVIAPSGKVRQWFRRPGFSLERS